MSRPATMVSPVLSRLVHHLPRGARERLSAPAVYATIATMTPTVSQVFSPGTSPKAASPAVPAAVIPTTTRMSELEPVACLSPCPVRSSRTRAR